MLYCTVTRCNKDHLDQVAELAVQWNVRAVKFNDLLPAGRGLDNYRQLSLGRDQWRDALDRLRNLRSRLGPMIGGTLLDAGDQYDAMGRATIGGDKAKVNCLSGCGTLINQCAVRPDGHITPCDRLPNLTVGNITEHRFSEIWRHAPGFNAFRQRRAVRLSDLEECSGCAYTALCTGGCPAVPHALFGKVSARDPLQCYRIHIGEEVFDAI
jgi:radical SAM protein with 4Fe4S-binding SPASM domain